MIPENLRQSRPFLLIVCVAAYSLALAVATIVLQNTGGHVITRLLIADLAATLVIFVAGQLARNSSLYDPYWSVTPPLLIAGYAILGDGIMGFPRSLVVFGLTSLYAWRLTHNCFRRWPNLAHEDFRYQDFRTSWGKFYPVIDLVGIQIIPTLFVFLGCLPFYAVYVASAAPWNALDWLALVVTAGSLVIAWSADRTLWQFRKTAKQGEVLSDGLWALSRHPNYFGEVSFWGGLFLFALASGFEFWWTGVGFAAMVLLFRFISIPLMEKREEARRPGYAETVSGRPLIIPWPRPTSRRAAEES